jgi:predicted RNA-binding Zn-ribbon protein involved in translation (DUF1610 family)
MSLLSAIPMRFFHESCYGRPSCPKCGEAMIAPETSKYLSRCRIGHVWVCEECDHEFETLIRFDAAA